MGERDQDLLLVVLGQLCHANNIAVPVLSIAHLELPGTYRRADRAFGVPQPDAGWTIGL